MKILGLREDDRLRSASTEFSGEYLDITENKSDRSLEKTVN
jgi:hypothetical protein